MVETQNIPVWNRWLLAASILMLLTTTVHAFVGGPEVYGPLRVATLDPIAMSVLSVVWHVVTVVLAVMAVGLLWTSRYRNRPFELGMVAMQLGFVGLFVGYGAADFGELLSMPQWTIFALMSGLVVMAGRAPGAGSAPESVS